MNILRVTKNYNELEEFCSYQIELENSNKQISVPIDEANRDYQAIQEWIADGGTVIDNGGSE